MTDAVEGAGDAVVSDVAGWIAARVVTAGDHLLWQGLTDRYGRGLVRVGGREVAVRRAIWRAAGNDIPPGHVLWGTCGRGECVAVVHGRLFARAVSREAADLDRYVAERAVADGNCLILPGASNRVRLDGRRMPVGRAVWKHVHGPVPAGWMVCHRCDRQHCGRLEHLYVASPEQRVRDSVDRRRFPLGEDVSQAKLTWAAVDYIRASTESRAALARRFGVSSSAVHKVRAGQSWRTRPAGFDTASPGDTSASSVAPSPPPLGRPGPEC